MTDHKALQDFMDKMPAKSPRSIIARLNDYCHARSGMPDFYRPEITLMVQGKVITGELYKLGSDDNREFIVLFSKEDNSLTTIEMQLVTSASVKNADKFAHVLSFGTIQRPLEEAAVGGLALSKKLKEIAEEINSYCGSTLQIDTQNAGVDIVNANIKDVAQTLLVTIKKIAADGFGKESVMKISKITFANVKDSALAVKKQGSEIIIESDYAAELSLATASILESGLNENL